MVAAQGKRSMSNLGKNIFWKTGRGKNTMILEEENLLIRIASCHCTKGDTQLHGGRCSVPIPAHGSR
jgi:hypothetical protein